MSKIYFVACVGKKASVAMPAKDLYQSEWFKKASAYAKSAGDQWYILSAKYGLVAPGDTIEPYDMTLNKMSKAERDNWAGQVMTQIEQELDETSDELYFLAGLNYREPLITWLVVDGWVTCVPMRGLGIGQQLKWLKEKLND